MKLVVKSMLLFFENVSSWLRFVFKLNIHLMRCRNLKIFAYINFFVYCLFLLFKSISLLMIHIVSLISTIRPSNCDRIKRPRHSKWRIGTFPELNIFCVIKRCQLQLKIIYVEAYYSSWKGWHVKPSIVINKYMFVILRRRRKKRTNTILF